MPLYYSGSNPIKELAESEKVVIKTLPEFPESLRGMELPNAILEICKNGPQQGKWEAYGSRTLWIRLRVFTPQQTKYKMHPNALCSSVLYSMSSLTNLKSDTRIPSLPCPPWNCQPGIPYSLVWLIGVRKYWGMRVVITEYKLY